MSQPSRSEAVERLERWARFGGSWRVVERCGERVTLALCRCDGGEELERFTTADSDALAWLAGPP